MAANRTTFEKLQRDRAKKAKAAAKRARKLGQPTPGNEIPAEPTSVDAEWTIGDSDKPLSASELLEAVEQLQSQFDSKLITEDEFEERKIDLLARVSND
ncbi:MAG: SHOCT domain-containing protein [Acidimicrobiia bacterium]